MVIHEMLNERVEMIWLYTRCSGTNGSWSGGSGSVTRFSDPTKFSHQICSYILTSYPHNFTNSYPQNHSTSQLQTHTVNMPPKMAEYEAFACPCGRGDVILRESHKYYSRGKLYYACPKSKGGTNDHGCNFFYGKRNESPWWPVLLELQHLQLIPQDHPHLQLVTLHDLQHRVLEIQSAQTSSNWITR